MNKKILYLLFLPFIISFLHAAEIKIAPLAVYDSDGKKTVPPFNPAKEVHSELEKHWFEGLVNFSLVSESRHGIPVTLIDANRICAVENTDYLLYGYIRKNETNWLSEIKLYSASEKKVVKEFFAGDSIEHYDRLMKVLCQNILYGIKEITGLNHDEVNQKKTRPLELKIPSSIFYWSPVDANWGSRILGIGGISAGAELYPVQPVMVTNEKLLDLSLRLNFSWDTGINKNGAYPLVLNTLSVSLPVIIHVHFNEVHSLYGGIGTAYGIEFMNIRPKYEDEKFLYQNVFSLEAVAGYEFAVNRNVSIFTEIVFDWQLSDGGCVSVKPTVGASFSIYEEK